MTTASVLFTVGTTWGPITEKHDKEKENARSFNVAEIAARELRETPNIREQTLNIMREWIQKNTDIRNVRQGNCLSRNGDLRGRMAWTPVLLVSPPRRSRVLSPANSI